MGGAECTSPGVTRRPLPWQWKVTRQRSPPCCPLQRVMWTAACLVLHNLQLQLLYELTTTSPLTANQPDENMKNRRITGDAHKRVRVNQKEKVCLWQAWRMNGEVERHRERERVYGRKRPYRVTAPAPPISSSLTSCTGSPALINI